MKRKTTNKASKLARKRSSAESFNLFSHIKEIGLLIATALALFFLISFISYNPGDPGWSKTAQNFIIANIAGSLGAWWSDLLLYFLGISAYWLPIIILYSCIIILFNNKFINNLLLWFVRIFGFIITVLASSSLISLLAQNYFINIYNLDLKLPVSLGGVLGDVIAIYLMDSANLWGSMLIIIPCLLAGITAITGISWVKLSLIIVISVYKFLIKIINIIIFAIKNLFIVIKNFNKKRGAVKKEFKENKENKENNFKNNNLTKTEQFKLAKNFVQQLKVNKQENNGSKNNKINLINRSSNKNINSSLPSINLLDQSSDNNIEYNSNLPDSNNIQEKLSDFGIVASIANIFPGPVVTRVELDLAPGTKVNKITSLSKDLARSFSVQSVRVVEVIPGKSVIGLEIPNNNRTLVRLRDILSSEQYLTSNSPLTLALGKDIAGVPVVADLARMPHLLVAGTTGSGKSVGVNVMLLSILFKVTPEEVRLILIDPKMLELSIYEGIPHLLTPVVTDMKDAAQALNWCVFEMERRYKLMASIGVRNLLSFNHKVQTAINSNDPLKNPLYNPSIAMDAQYNKEHLDKLPYIVVIIDEFADMMMVVGKKVEEQIARIAQKARAAGIHMILATQRPSVDVITGLIKANIPTRIAYQVSSRIDSRTILDQQGAEQLLGHGDLLYLPPGSGIPVRVHGAFVSDDEVHKVVNELKASYSELNNDNPTIDFNQIDNSLEINLNGANNLEEDSLYDKAVFIVTSSRKASISYLQRRLKIGFNRAANLIEQMQEQGVVTAVQNNGTREVIAPPPVDVIK